MNSKYLSILIICSLGVILCMGAVCAKSMTSQNFGDFRVDVPKNSDFVEQDLDVDESENSDIPLSGETYVDEKNILMLVYIDSPLFAGENNAAIYQLMFSTTNPDLNQSYESQEGNLRIIEPVKKSEMNFSMVGLTSGNKTMLIFGQDVDLLKEMGHSVKFS